MGSGMGIRDSFSGVGRTAGVVGHRVDERTGYIADLRRAQVHQIAREGRLGDVNPPLGQASAQSFLATDRLGRQKITDHLMTRTLGARKRGCCTHMHDYTHERI